MRGRVRRAPRARRTLAEGVGFEPTVELPLLLISSQVPLTTQPPFRDSGLLAYANSRTGAMALLPWPAIRNAQDNVPDDATAD